MSTVRRLGASVGRQLRRLERRIGAERPDRSVWVWLVPVGTMGATIGMIIYYGEMGGLQLAASIPLAIFSGLFMFGTSAAYLAADVEQEAGSDRRHTTDAPPPPAPSEPWFIREASPWPGPLEVDMAGEEPLQPVHGGVDRLR